MRQTAQTPAIPPQPTPAPGLRRAAMAVLLATLFVTAIPLAVADGEPEPPVSEPVDEVPGTEPCHVTLDPDQAPYAYVDC